jgi:hypothetical protein
MFVLGTGTGLIILDLLDTTGALHRIILKGLELVIDSIRHSSHEWRTAVR